jgi:glycosyltransferase involved in cell wall biosynthesis
VASGSLASRTEVNLDSAHRMRLLSIVEATSVTGPVKPLLMFSRLARAGVGGRAPIEHSLVTTQRAGTDNELMRAAREQGLPVDVVPERFAFDPRVLAHMARSIRQRAPDIVETHDFESHFLFLALKGVGAVSGVRWVAFHHGYTRMSSRVRAYQQLDRVSLRHADRVVTLCRPFVEQLVSRGVRRDRIDVISNAVIPQARPASAALTALRASLGLTDSDKILVSVGRLSREKGHADLIDAFRILLERGKCADCRLLLVGDGGERAALQSKAASLGNRVLFAGHQADPWAYFCIGDVFVLPSHTEGSPLVLFEAMAAGLPIVATSVGGVPEVVEDQRTAILVPAMDATRLAESIALIVDNRAAASALGADAHRAINAFSPEAYTARLLGVYAKVAAVAD